MIVANALSMGQTVSTGPQLGPFCCIDFSAKKSTNFSFVFGFGLGCSGFHSNNNRNSTSKSYAFSSDKNRKNSALHCTRCSNNNSNVSLSSALGWDWNRWNRHFSEIEQAESYASVLKFQLEDAVENEDFHEAAKLKRAIAEATSKDNVAELMFQLKNAIVEERYHDAARLSKNTGSGLVGWWVGYSADSDDPFGRLVRITPGVGRFVGRSYTPRQLVNASPGTPLFEIFVVKDADERYVMQAGVCLKYSYTIVTVLSFSTIASTIRVNMVVCLKQAKSTNSSTLSKSTQSQSTSEVENASAVDAQENEVKTERSEEKGVNIEGASEEGIKSVINFLKDKIPGFKVKVMNITDEAIDDNDSVKQFMQEDDEKSESGDTSEDDASELEEVQPDELDLETDDDSSEDGKDLDTKFFIGGVVHNNEDTPTKDDFVRLPAEIKDVERDSFVLHVPRSPETDDKESQASTRRLELRPPKSVSELMPPDVAKAFLVADRVPSKVSRHMREIIKRELAKAQKKPNLAEFTTFSRIATSSSNLDPFDGLYVGAFGPYGIEVVQLKRKFGHWNGVNDNSDMEFFEYVEAVKLTGDLNVPAGQVTFRAKIGKAGRNSNRGMYPDELGVVASYKGQGRMAEIGFRNPQWVDGELLQLNGKGIGPYVKGADLGFLYVVPEQSFLVLFNRLKLPE
ncbi:hypothetical protein Tsubulata_030977 [Turnera subulata]|uniref:Protein EXECUTER 2, chloroplastic n=1 Tax=Turnera subulata TaxID=218843 RepID=A0A9Q0J5D9_9ROSI|nr:hypothetical protein Tsubulata_030977 [Turnera subulata]